MSTTVNTSPLARQLKRIWASIPEDRWLAERELDELLLRSVGAYEGDFARASALRQQLLSAKALEARRVDGTRDVEYRRAGWTDWPLNNGPGSEGFNQALRAQHEANLAELDAQRQRELEDSPWGQQQQQLVQLIEATVDRRVRELLQELDESAIERARARLAADDAA